MAADDTPTTAPCSACRGTGKLISNLGGAPTEIACPWCEGRGRRLGSDHDAQAAGRRARGDDEPPDQAA